MSKELRARATMGGHLHTAWEPITESRLKRLSLIARMTIEVEEREVGPWTRRK